MSGTPNARRRRRWFQFSLRGLLALVLLTALGAFTYRTYVEPYRRQREVVRAIGELKGTLQTSAADSWQRWLFGDDFQNITLIDVANCDEPDKFLPLVADLPRLEVLVVGGLSFHEEHLRRLHRLASLHWLVLDSTDVSADGVATFQTSLAQAKVHRSSRRAWNVLFDKLIAISVDSPEPELVDEHAELAQRIDRAHFFKFGEVEIGTPDDAMPATIRDAARWLAVLDASSLFVMPSFNNEYLAFPRQLRSLQLASLEVTDATLDQIGQLERLEKLMFVATRVTPAGLRHLQPLQRLRELRLVSLRAADEGLAQLTSQSELRKLSLSHSGVTDMGLRYLSENLEELELDSTYVTDRGMVHVAGLTHLKRLDLQGTRVGGDGVEHFKNLRELEYLTLNLDTPTEVGQKLLAELPNLKEVRLAGHSLSQSIVRGHSLSPQKGRSTAVAGPSDELEPPARRPIGAIPPPHP